MKYYNLIFSCFFINACDIPGRLIIQNKSRDIAYYKYTTANTEKIYELTRKNTDSSEVNFLYGFGYFWTEGRIKKYLSDKEKIEIFSKNDTIILANQKDMFTFFKDRRKLFNKYIKITIK